MFSFYLPMSCKYVR